MVNWATALRTPPSNPATLNLCKTQPLGRIRRQKPMLPHKPTLPQTPTLPPLPTVPSTEQATPPLRATPP